MTQDLNRLQVFREVVQAGSFSKAAAHLKQPKSRVSRQIATLERDLGVQLIYRTTRQFQLTQAGKDLFEKAGPLLLALKSTLEEVSLEADEVSGPIRLTVPEDLGTEVFGELLHEFWSAYPKVQIALLATNERVDLVRQSVDMAVRIGKVKDSTMIQRKVGSVEMLFVASPQLLKSFGSIATLEDLEKLPYLSFSLADLRRHQVKVSNGKESRTLKMQTQFASNNFFALRSMALQGAGVTMLPAFLVRDFVRTGALVHLVKEWRAEGSPVNILVPQQKELPLRVRKLLEFLVLKLQAFL